VAIKRRSENLKTTGEGRKERNAKEAEVQEGIETFIVNFQVVEPLEILPIDYLLPQQTHFFGFPFTFTHIHVGNPNSGRNRVKR
jgi:hypothetical protein